MRFDVQAIFNLFGGRSTIFARLNTRRHPITIRALDKWRERGSIPPIWLAHITKLADADGIAFNLHAYLLRDATPKNEAKAEELHSLLD
ncbi:hypothetical protein D3C76_1324530 [compost metagenome]